MTHCLFIHDFFQDGRLDVLAEVRLLQVYGQWTKEKHARWIKQACTAYERAKRTYPLGCSYNAGRIAGLKSAVTAHYPTLDPQFHGRMVFLILRDEKKIRCLECGDDATWKCYPDGSFHLTFYLCDRCKQERVREHSAQALSGSNGFDVALLPLPVLRSPWLLKKAAREVSSVLLSGATVLSFDLSNFLWPVPYTVLLSQSLLIVLVACLCKPLLRLLTDSEDGS